MPETGKVPYMPHQSDLREVKQDRANTSGSRQKGSLFSLVGGGLLTLVGLKRRSAGRLMLAGLGTGLLFHGLQGLRTSSTSELGRRKIKPSQGVKIEDTIIIHRQSKDLFRFWRQLDNLPKFMDEIHNIDILSPTRSRWTMTIPVLENIPGPSTVEWEAEIINEKENELIGWRTLANSNVEHTGSVQFNPVDDGNSTEVRITLQYVPVGGVLGVGILKMLGEDPLLKVKQNLLKFKELMEAELEQE